MTASTRTAGQPGCPPGHPPARRGLDGRWWLITLATVAGIAITAALGCWQLNRAAQKEALAAAMASRAQQAPLDAPALLQALATAPADAGPGREGLDRLVHRPVALQGRWLVQHTVYLDNRQMHGRPGFFVLTPLALALPSQTPAVVWVQRGWVPRNFLDRTALPPVDSPEGLVSVQGRLALEPARLYALDPRADPEPETARIRQNLDMARFQAQTGLPLLAVSVVQTGAASEGLQRDWPRVDAGVHKHLGYAAQWFGFSVLMAVLYVWFQLIRRFVRPSVRPPV